MKFWKTGFLAGVVSLAVAGAATVALSPSPAIAAPHDHAHAELGLPAPDFTLTDVFGKSHTLSDYTEDGKVVVLEWFNPDCPYVKRHHKKHRTMAETADKFDGVVWLAINSGAKGKQGAGVDRNKRAVKEFDIEYPVLIDDRGEIGHIYGAKTTPDMFIINKEGTLVYAGAIDNDRAGRNIGGSGYVNYVAQALDQLKKGETVTTSKTKPYGCSVKYAH